MRNVLLLFIGMSISSTVFAGISPSTKFSCKVRFSTDEDLVGAMTSEPLSALTLMQSMGKIGLNKINGTPGMIFIYKELTLYTDPSEKEFMYLNTEMVNAHNPSRSVVTIWPIDGKSVELNVVKSEVTRVVDQKNKEKELEIFYTHNMICTVL